MQIFKQHGSWHVRFYQNGKRISKRLCSAGTDAKEAKRLAATIMLEYASGKVEAIDQRRPEVLVFDFWSGTFLPYVESNLKPSSVHGYKKLWDGVLEVHFRDRTLEGYKTVHGNGDRADQADGERGLSAGDAPPCRSPYYDQVLQEGNADRDDEGNASGRSRVDEIARLFGYLRLRLRRTSEAFGIEHAFRVVRRLGEPSRRRSRARA